MLVMTKPAPALAIHELGTRARIAAWALSDHWTRPIAQDVKDVPWHADAISPAWLSAVLSSMSGGAGIQAIHTLGGDQGSSLRRRLQLHWQSEHPDRLLPTSVFSKSTPTLAMRLSAGIAAVAEGRFLLEADPSLTIEKPACWYSARDAATGRSMHIMEDLVMTKGAQFLNADSVLTEAEALQVTQTLATLHGHFLQSASPAPAWLATYEDFFTAARRSGIEAAHQTAMQRASSVIPPTLRGQGTSLWQAAERALILHQTPERTVIHSDVHVGNWYRTGEGRLGLCDWARVCRGHWGRDLAYALATTLTVDQRRHWESGLLEHYVEVRNQFTHGRTTLEAAQLACRQHAFAALLMWTPTLCPPDILPAMQPEQVSLTMIHRITTAIDDHNALDSI